MGKNPSKAPLIQGVITDAAPQRDVWRENKWSATDPTRKCLWSPTQRSTTIPSQRTGTPSPEAPAISQRRIPPPKATPISSQKRHQRRASHRLQESWTEPGRRNWQKPRTTAKTTTTISACPTCRWPTTSSRAWRTSPPGNGSGIISRRARSFLGRLTVRPPAAADVVEKGGGIKLCFFLVAHFSLPLVGARHFRFVR